MREITIGLRCLVAAVAFGAAVLTAPGCGKSPKPHPGCEAREIPVRTPEQRALLDRAHQLAGRGSLIPGERNYRQQLRVYERHTANAGLSKLHGLRHAYAQARYVELTGWEPPAAGGRSSESLSGGERAVDREARLAISRELGHEREQITAVYLGR